MIGLPFNYNIAFDFCDLYYFCYETGLLQEHLVLGLEVSDGIVNLLCHAVVVLALASGKAERAFDSRAR